MQGFDLVAKIYDKVNNSRYQRDLREVLRFLNPQKGENILDIGGGTGALAHLVFEKTGCRMTIVDPSAGMLAIGKEKKYQAEFLQGDLANTLPISDNSVDGIVMVYALHHIKRDTQVKAIQEISRILKKGGRILFIEMDYHNLYSFFLNIQEKLMTLNRVWFTGSPELEILLHNVGIEVEQCEAKRQGYSLYAVKR